MCKIKTASFTYQGFSSGGKESACNVGDQGSMPGLGRSLGEGNGNPLQYSWLGNLMDQGAWWATVHGGCKRVEHDLVTKQQQGYKTPTRLGPSLIRSAEYQCC